MFLLIFGSLPILAFQLIQRHCRLLAPGFSRDRDTVASWEPFGPLCAHLSGTRRKRAQPLPHWVSTGSFSRDPGKHQCSQRSWGQCVTSQSAAEPPISHRKHKQISYHSTEKYTQLSAPQKPRRILITNQQVHPRTTVRTALGSVAAHFGQHISTHPCFKDPLKHSVSVTSKILVGGGG